jgi:cell volume regulation protein A
VQRPYAQLPLPPRSQVVTALRDGAVVPLFRIERFLPGDQILLLCPPEQTLALDRLFLPRARLSGLDEERLLGDFSFPGTTPLGALADAYGLPVAEAERPLPVGNYVRHRLNGTPTIGDRVPLGTVELIARDIQGNEITQVGILLEPEPARILPGWFEQRLHRLLAWRQKTEEPQTAASQGAEPSPSETTGVPRQAAG